MGLCNIQFIAFHIIRTPLPVRKHIVDCFKYIHVLKILVLLLTLDILGNPFLHKLQIT